MAASFVKKITQKFRSLSLDILLPIFILLFVLEMVHFFPSLQEINIWDEATYIQSGYLLLTEGALPNLANSPLSSAMFALAMLPVLQSPNFFVLADAIARIFLFSLIFFSASLIARQLKPFANPWVMVAMIFIIPVATTMYLYPSDVLFAGFSGLAFWQMLAFYNRRKRIHLWWASGLMGVGMLARAEGLLLIGVMAVVTLVIAIPKRKWFKDLVAVLLPFIILVGGYILVYGIVKGDFSTGLPQRTYYNFQSGHEGVYSQTGKYTPTVSARIESDEIFGTAEENNYSVFKAIRNNPRIYLERLKLVVPSFVQLAIKAYGNKFILIFIWLSLRGMVALVNKKHTPLVLMGVLWFIPLGVGFLNTFFREGYFMIPYFVVFALSSIGLSAIIENFEKRSEKIWLIVASFIVLAISALAQNTSMAFRASLFIFGFVMLFVIYHHLKHPKKWHLIAWWVLLAIALIIRGGYPSPEWPQYAHLDVERSVYFLQDNFPQGSRILAGSPANIWAARMTYFGINSFDIPDFENAEDFLAWVQSQEIVAVYVDRTFPETYRKYVMDLKESRLQQIFVTPENDIIIFSVTEDGS